MFDSLQPAPPDPILGLSEAFAADPRQDKINLSVGVYKDAAGQTPVLRSVKQAEARLLETERSKGYLGIDGDAAYRRCVPPLLLGGDHAALAAKRVACLQAPGGTGALRIAADLLHRLDFSGRVWISQPTWPNHRQIFESAGLAVGNYPYADASFRAIDFTALLGHLAQLPSGDAVVLHASCHNPTGIDPTTEQWDELAAAIRERGLLPIVDCAYQGFGDGVDEDVAGLRRLCQEGETLVCSSFSKNLGLYGERVGALTIVASSDQAATSAASHAKSAVRANYSNPPRHGGLVVATVLEDAGLRTLWLEELADMRARIHQMRHAFVEGMAARLPQRDFGFLVRQRGMFSFSGLNPMQVDRLKQEFGIYIVGSGRINVAGITPGNLDRLCDAVAAVCADA